MNKSLWTVLASAMVLSGGASEAAADEYCREYTKAVNVGGQRQQGYGTACMQPDGSWRVASQDLVDDEIAVQTSPTIIRERVVYTEPRPVYVVNNGWYPRHHYRPRHYGWYDRPYRSGVSFNVISFNDNHSHHKGGHGKGHGGHGRHH